MKKIFCFCIVLCIISLYGCKSKQNNGIEESIAANGADLIPVIAHSMTISYNDYIGNMTEPEIKTYTADNQQFRQFCDLLKGAKIVQLSDNDTFSFGTLDYVNAADISVRFDTGELLRIYLEGGIGRYIDDKFMGLPGMESYSVSLDLIHQLQKILIPDFEKDYQALFMEPNFVKAEDINAGNVNEIPFFVPQGRKIFTISDGFIAFNRVWGGSNANSFLRAIKYDAQGNFVWMQNYSDIKLEYIWYGLSECIETKDGGFALSVHGDVWFRSLESWVPGDKEEAIITLGWLFKCDNNGNIVWKEQLEFRGGTEAQWICETESGDILTAGACQTDDGEHYKNGDSSHSYTDLLLMKFNKNGKCTGFRKYGGSDFDSFRDACYSPDVGLVIWGSTQSCDGDITQRKERGTMLGEREFLAVFGDDLSEKWQYVFEEHEEIYTSYAVTVDKQIYVTGSLSKNTGKHNQTAVFKFNNDGKIVKSKTINAKTVMGICAAADDTVLVLVNPSAYSDNSAQPQIHKLDTNLEIKKTINDSATNGFSYNVIPTDDNGFFTIQVQLVKYLPQPLWMNRSMTDSATVLSRYDANGKLLYRKTYDKNHEVEDIDIIIPLSDGRVIIGR